MKEGMNESRARMNLFDVALPEQGDVFERNVSDEKMRVYFALFFERVVAVHTAAQQHLKGAGKSMLVDAGSAVQPVINADMESGTGVKRDRRISEFPMGIHLMWQIGSGMDPANDLPGIDPRSQVGLP